MPVKRVGGRELHYLDSGVEGPALLLLHGFPLSAAMWAPQFEGLGDRFRLVAPSLPGFGGSDAPNEPLTWRIEDYADTANELLDLLGIERAVVAGLSMGGYVAFSLLRRHPQRVKALVLADTRSGADSLETQGDRTKQQEEVREKGTAALEARLMERLLAPMNLGDPVLGKKVRALLEGHPMDGWLAALEAMKRRPDSTPDLGRIEVPTLVVVGAEDVITPPAAARAMAASIPGARLAELPGSGHMANVESPAAFNEALASFLAGL